MKTLLSLLFYIFMAGTTATVGTGLGDALPSAAAPLIENPSIESNVLKSAAPALKTAANTISFKAFGVRKGTGGAVITWAASPVQGASFVVEKSADGKTFTSVAAIQPSGEVAHKFCDSNNPSAAGFYRVQAVTAGTEAVYSAPKKVRAAR